MKREGFLIERIAERSNLVLALAKARRGLARGRRQTPDGAEAERMLGRLARGILDGTVELGRYRRFEVFDPKRRLIHAPVYEERVLHHAILNVIGPRIERCLIGQSFACREGLGTSAALREAERWVRRAPFVLCLDVRRYFDSIEHRTLLGSLSRLFKDPNLLALLARIVGSYETAPGRGVPIGALTSQHFGNLYLAPVDRLVKQGLRAAGYVRYMDDLRVFGESRDRLRAAEEALRGQAADLGLEFKPGKIASVGQGVPFLGWRLLPGGRRLSAARKRRVRARIASLDRLHRRGGIGTAALARRAGSLFAHLEHPGTLGLRRSLLVRWPLDGEARA